ncbi:Maltose/maltodextrin import ATP-binding protein MalK {ECO:0000255/HAMAP-Rule:MF_01709} [Pantoea ananatis]|nr:Maltose/maltodextrin import ATP-binding protein MalK [Pantoea ananatis]CRH38352.1 Maltose/maltodextrin import ATP-binding protein MalK {ECO:0000255/HAMAP-Rule:MF_01709} [Pantoea ananatis]
MRAALASGEESTMASVVLRNVTKAWGDTVVSNDINLEIGEGEFVVFVGPSGCGKSTLLRMIAGLETITRGELLIGDKRMNEVPPAERGIGMVFQSYALYPHLSVAENMSFGLKLAGVKKAEREQRVTQVAEVLQLAHLLDRRPKALSGGQRQRVAIGRTLVAEPRVFLLDEPLSNLDAALRVQMRIEISRLHKRLRRTMIYVTHDQIEAMTLADKIVVLDAGRVAQVGRPLELYHYPANRFVAGFIGSPKMNFLPVKVTATAIEQVQVRLPNNQLVWLPVDSANVQVGSNMSLGIRPEHLLSSDIADVTLEGEVQVVEQLGHETQIHIQIPAIRQNLVYRQEDVVLVKEGAMMGIGLPPERCHLFREDGSACRRLHQEPGV